jgi:hypothetical protein
MGMLITYQGLLFILVPQYIVESNFLLISENVSKIDFYVKDYFYGKTTCSSNPFLPWNI